MADHSNEVSLPYCVEQLLEKICADQGQPFPDLRVRRELALLGEEAALQILTSISKSSVINLGGLIIYKIRKVAESPEKNIFRSPNQSPSSSRPYSPQGGSAKAVPCSPVVQNLRFTQCCSLERGDIRAALGELEFRKAFLILNYIGREELEKVTTANQIRRMKDLPMGKFELEVWRELGQKYINQEDRRVYVDWDARRTHYYHCYVSLDGLIRFKGPYLNKTKTHLQRVLGDENVLMVKFAEDVRESSQIMNLSITYAVYNKFAKDGIVVGLRRYRFFVFKDGGKEEKKKNPSTSPVKCFFIRMESEAAVDNCNSYKLSNKTIYEARSCFMHAHSLSSVASYMSRFALILSKTVSLKIDLSTVNIQRIEDLYCHDEDGNIVYRDGKPLIHTDGTGYISEDLAFECPKNLFKGQLTSENNVEGVFGKDLSKDIAEIKQQSYTEVPPLLIQFRLFYNGYAVKGTFLVNRQLSSRTIQIRNSMIKVESDSKFEHLQTENSLEIVGTSNPPKRTNLSRNLIALLSYGGVPEEYFMHILMKAVNEVDIAFSSKRAALKVAINCGQMDDFLVARMILSGVPLEESYLQYRLSLLIKEEKKSLKGGRLHVPECYYLMGTADPTRRLESGQVCIILESGQISGKVLVYRNPGLHFGDIHVLEATYVKAIQDVVGNAKYGIFFSTKGPRSVADEIAGGDFDGDMYWVSRNPQLLEYFKVSKPWTPIPSMQKVFNKKPSEFSPEALEDELFKIFLKTRFEPSYTKSVAADSWLTLMDQLLMLGEDDKEKKNILKANIVQLIDIYYEALDAPKKGGKIDLPDELKVKSFPHFMERGKNSYISTSILGLIYDTAKNCQEEDLPNIDVKKLSCFEDDIPEESLKKWKSHYELYRSEMRAALQLDPEVKNEAAEAVIAKYREILYGASDLDKSSRTTGEVFQEALAIYQITYEYAMKQNSVKYCSFAWRVAGSALFKICASKQSETIFLCHPSVLREVVLGLM